jgi:biotin carboxyl carrier protein
VIGCGPDLSRERTSDAAQGTDEPLDRSTDRLFPPKALLRNDRNKQTTMSEIKVPTIAGSSKLSIGRWFKREGDPVTFREPLVEIDTDNVTREIQAPATGILSRILVRDGGTVEPGTVVGMIDQI